MSLKLVNRPPAPLSFDPCRVTAGKIVKPRQARKSKCLPASRQLIGTHDINLSFDINWDSNIGTGVSGKVLTARCRETNVDFALKVLPYSRRACVEVLTQLRMSLLNPHIAKIHFVFLNRHRSRPGVGAKPHLFVLMRREATDLFRRLRTNGPLDEQSCKIIMRQLVQAIKCMHTNSVVHRDIKPENILLDDGLTVRLADFGFAAMVGECSAPEYTQAYIPPETVISRRRVMAGQPPLPVDRPADMWSLGVSLYVMLTFTFPFTAELRTSADEERVLAGRIPLTSLSGVSDDARRVLRSLLCVNPEERITIEQLEVDPWLQ